MLQANEVWCQPEKSPTPADSAMTEDGRSEEDDELGAVHHSRNWAATTYFGYGTELVLPQGVNNAWYTR